MKNSFFIHFRSAYVAAGAISHHISWFGSRTEHIAIKGSRAPPGCTNEKPHPGGHPDTANAKPTTLKSKSVLPFHHTTPACAAQAEKGSSQNPYFI